MSKHTPKALTVDIAETRNNLNYCYFVDDPNRGVMSPVTLESRKAIIILLKAAPTMLAALEAMAELICQDRQPNKDEYVDLWQTCKAAIALATGKEK